LVWRTQEWEGRVKIVVLVNVKWRVCEWVLENTEGGWTNIPIGPQGSELDTMKTAILVSLIHKIIEDLHGNSSFKKVLSNQKKDESSRVN
jgi:hypothetical protein